MATPPSNCAAGGYPRGVQRNGKTTFMARIRYNGVVHYIGTYKTPDEASEAYKQRRLTLLGSFEVEA